MWGKRKSSAALYTASDAKRFRRLDQEYEANPFIVDLQAVTSCYAVRRLAHKQQLFPTGQHDYLRTRLTHSLEVGQIARRVASELVKSEPFFAENPISLDLLEVAALCHDIGHPPFGHMGERALNQMMAPWGGFEGNAQTLRLISRLEAAARQGANEEGEDGLNLTARSLASVIKYDRVLKPVSDGCPQRVSKGFYQSESDIVEFCRHNVFGGGRATDRKFPSIECSIMDISDDIAYSIYDLDDSLQTGYLSGLSTVFPDHEIVEEVASDVSKTLETTVLVNDVRAVLKFFFKVALGSENSVFSKAITDDEKVRTIRNVFRIKSSRNHLLAGLVREFTSKVRVRVDSDVPAASVATLEGETKLRVEILKSLVFHAVTRSPEIQITEFRAGQVIKALFNALISPQAIELFPRRSRKVIAAMSGHSDERRARLVCDYISEMTDHYANDLFDRLHAGTRQTIYKPV